MAIEALVTLVVGAAAALVEGLVVVQAGLSMNELGRLLHGGITLAGRECYLILKITSDYLFFLQISKNGI